MQTRQEASICLLFSPLPIVIPTQYTTYRMKRGTYNTQLACHYDVGSPAFCCIAGRKLAVPSLSSFSHEFIVSRLAFALAHLHTHTGALQKHSRSRKFLSSERSAKTNGREKETCKIVRATKERENPALTLMQQRATKEPSPMAIGCPDQASTTSDSTNLVCCFILFIWFLFPFLFKSSLSLPPNLLQFLLDYKVFKLPVFSNSF